LADSIDIGSFLSALVGAAAALGGVVITQRSQRRSAHADRIWSARTAAYGAMHQMLEADLRILRREDIDSLPEGGRDILDSPLPRDSSQQLYLFGSKPVLDAYGEYYRAVADVLSAAESGKPMQAALRAAATKGVRLQQMISSETRGE
jgi:hypothetical protein